LDQGAHLKTTIHIALLTLPLTAVPAFATAPGPVMGDSVSGLAALAFLGGVYFLFRHLRKKRQA
jgi:hypothetical protein